MSVLPDRLSGCPCLGMRPEDIRTIITCSKSVFFGIPLKLSFSVYRRWGANLEENRVPCFPSIHERSTGKVQ